MWVFSTSLGVCFPSVPAAVCWGHSWGRGLGDSLARLQDCAASVVQPARGGAALWLSFVLPHIDFQIWSLFGNSSWNVDKRRSTTRSSLWQTTQLLRSTWVSVWGVSRKGPQNLPECWTLAHQSLAVCAGKVLNTGIWTLFLREVWCHLLGRPHSWNCLPGEEFPGDLKVPTPFPTLSGPSRYQE